MADWIERDRQMIWHPFGPLHGPDPVLVAAGRGPYLITEDGREILDAISSWWVNLHGHAHPAIAAAISRQAAQLEHVIFAGFTHQPAIRLAEALMKVLPGPASRIFFSDDGSTAVEVGLKMGMQYWHNLGEERTRVIALDGAYHGDTFGAMSVGARGLFSDPWRRYLFQVDHIPLPQHGNEKVALDRFRHLLRTGEVGIFIFEPLIQAAAGMRMYRPEVLDEMIFQAHQSEVVCVADEVFTGFGRTGRLFACDYLSNQPDIVAVSKGLTGGTLPLGVTACSARIEHAFESSQMTKTFFHGHSFTANPLSCTAAIASLELLTDPSCRKNIDRITKEHEGFVTQIANHASVSNARSLGTVLAVELRSRHATSYENKLREKIYPFFMERDILLRPLGNVLYVVPPYVTATSDLRRVYAALLEFMDRLKADSASID